MVSKLKVIALGGLGEIGKNMYAYEFGNDIIVVDCGMGFPDEDMYGIDSVFPDISYLRANQEKLRGIILTHGHEDHIGAIPYVLRDLDVPIYTLPLTAALIELKLEEHNLLYNTQIFTKKAGSSFRLGCFTVEFIHVNHSIPDAVAVAITSDTHLRQDDRPCPLRPARQRGRACPDGRVDQCGGARPLRFREQGGGEL